VSELFLIDGIVINAAYVLTTGMVLSGYAIFMGAGDFLTAVINNSVNYSTILSLFSFIIFERLAKRKKTLLTLNLISRILTCLIITLPFIPGGTSAKLVLMTTMVIASDVIWSVYRVGWLVWMMDFVPKENSTRFVYLRMLLIRIGMSLTTLLSGVILDHFRKGYTGFLIIYIGSFILSLIDIFILNKVEDVEHKVTADSSGRVKLFVEPVKMAEYRNFLIFLVLFYLFQTMASTFTPIYLIKYLKLDYKLISVINVISLFVMIMANRFWQMFESRKGFRLTLCVTSFFIAGELLILSFVNTSTFYLLFISTIVSGIGNGGFGVSIFTYRYEISPVEGRTMYEGWFYFSSGIGMLAAPFLGNALMVIVPDGSFLYTKSSFQVLYLISFILVSLLTFISYANLSNRKNINVETNLSD